MRTSDRPLSPIASTNRALRRCALVITAALALGCSSAGSRGVSAQPRRLPPPGTAPAAPPGPITGGLLLLHDGMVLLSDTVDPSWLAGTPSLVSGDIVEMDPACEDDPPDYEAEQGRYWDCASTDPKNVYDRFVASQPLDEEALPSPLAAWKGKRLALYGRAGKPCEASIVALTAWGERSATMEALGALEYEGESVAEAVIDHHAVILGELDGSCAGAVFARALELAPPPQWMLGTPDGALASQIAAELPTMLNFHTVTEGAASIEANTALALGALSPPRAGRRYAFASLSGPLGCHEDGFAFALWEVTSDGALKLLFADSHAPFAITAAADVSGDDIPEILLDDGQLVWDGEFYERVSPLAFPAEPRDPCHCECE